MITIIRHSFATVGFAAFLGLTGCATTGKLNTSSGRPEIAVRHQDWKSASVMIASYNMSKGRELDRVKPGSVVLYEGIAGPDGKLQVTSKLVYMLRQSNDSLYITSQKYVTDDLDDDSVAETLDQATLDAQQQDLDEIARMLVQPRTAGESRAQ